MSQRIPVLCYHALHVPGTAYAENDHVALSEDLAVIRELGFRVARLRDIVEFACSRGSSGLERGRWVGISFDDGTDYDYFDIVAYPHLGTVKSCLTILREAADASDPGWSTPCAVSFVIASPQARETLDRTCIAGNNNWRDEWWADASRSGVLEIGNHSWDHAHTTVARVAQRDQRKGTFLGIDNEYDADMQICAAQAYINHIVQGASSQLFAYPYGDVPRYLADEYFPRFTGRHQQVAAFTTAGDYVSKASSRWELPRFVCGDHWSTPEQLVRILTQA